MRWAIVRLGLPLVMIVAGAALLAYAGSAQQTTPRAIVPALAADSAPAAATATATPTRTATPSPTPTQTTGTVAAEVSIQGFAFSPASVTVRTGEAVRWTHSDPGASHGVTIPAGAFQSPIGFAGLTFMFTFGASGTYSYRCSVHSFMTGSVVVAD